MFLTWFPGLRCDSNIASSITCENNSLNWSPEPAAIIYKQAHELHTDFRPFVFLTLTLFLIYSTGSPCQPSRRLSTTFFPIRNTTQLLRIYLRLVLHWQFLLVIQSAKCFSFMFSQPYFFLAPTAARIPHDQRLSLLTLMLIFFPQSNLTLTIILHQVQAAT